MNCAEFEDVVEALGRGDPLDEGVRQRALGHAAVCATCNCQLEEARTLTAILRSMARQNSDIGAPAAVEAQVMEAFEQRHAGRATCFRRYWALVGNAAALFLLGIALTTLGPRPTPLAKDRHAGTTVASVDSGTEDSAEIATEFFPLQGDVDPAEQESSGVVRVWLPRTTLLAFGLPMNDERTLEPLQAEILVGEDGAVRAIRFLNERP
jgi:hypothetical protein